MDATAAQAYTLPEGKSPVILQFNKITGALISVIHDNDIDIETLGHPELFTYARAEFDFENDAVVGNYPNHQIKAKAELPRTIYESAMDAAARDKITARYPVIQQVNVLSRAIMKLSEKLGVEQTELVDMIDYINEVKEANGIRKEFYQQSSDYEYISNEAQQALEADQLEGGIHELYGPQPDKGGSVF